MLNILFVPSRSIGFEIKNNKIEVIQNNITSMDTKIHLDEAAKIFNNGNFFDYIICSAGIFLPENMQTVPGSVLMKEYLVKNYNIREEKILVEDKSVDSMENVKFTKEILEKMGQNIENIDMTCIAHKLHNARFRNIFRYFGFKKVHFIDLHYKFSFKLLLIECIGILISFLDPSASSSLLEKERNKRRNRELSGILKSYYK